MLSLRSLARSVPRSSRILSGLRPSSTCPASTRFVPAQWRIPTQRPHLSAPFSTSRCRCESEGEGLAPLELRNGFPEADAKQINAVNQELSAKIESEIAMEKDMRDPGGQPDPVREYLANSPFQLHDTPGNQEVVLTRTFGDEKIRITFSCDDLNNAPDEDDASLTDTAMQDADLEPDPADLPTDTQSGGANTKGSVNQGRTASGNLRVAPEDNVAPSDRESASEEESDDQEDQEQERNFPARLFITIERPKKGALQVEAVAQDGVIGIDNVYYYKDAKLVDPATQEDEANAARAYTGPPFGNLDEDLQVLFEKYLDERGINTTMALFVPEYIDYKELREYLGWMKNVKDFVE